MFLSATVLESRDLTPISFLDRSVAVEPEVGEPVLFEESDFPVELELFKEPEPFTREPGTFDDVPVTRPNFEDAGFFEAGPLDTPGLSPVWVLGDPVPEELPVFPILELSLDLVLFMVSFIPSEEGLTTYSAGSLTPSVIF